MSELNEILIKEFFDTICAESPSADSQQLQTLLLSYVTHPNFMSTEALIHHAVFNALTQHATAAPVVAVLIACLAAQHPDQLQHNRLPHFLGALLKSLSAGNDNAKACRPVFTILYYLFPCSTIQYLRLHGTAIQGTITVGPINSASIIPRLTK